MPRSKKVAEQPKKRRPPALTPEARENQLVSLAVDLAEKQLLEGTASSQIISHYVKMASMKERLEKERLQHEVELLKAKTEAIKSAKRVEELYKSALDAMKSYNGQESEPDDED